MLYLTVLHPTSGGRVLLLVAPCTLSSPLSVEFGLGEYIWPQDGQSLPRYLGFRRRTYCPKASILPGRTGARVTALECTVILADARFLFYRDLG